MRVVNCTFFDNFADIVGGAISNSDSGSIITNSIFWGNEASAASSIYSLGTPPQVTYCNVEGGYPGTGNIDVNPLFISPELNDFRLQYASQCIDVGNNVALFIPPAGTISYWRLDEPVAGGPYLDSVAVNDGISIGPPDPIPVVGKVNNGQQFNGVNTGIDVPADPSFDFAAAGSFSLECWVKTPPPSPNPSNIQVLIGRDDTNFNWHLGIQTDGTAVFNLSEGGNVNVTGTTILWDDTWHHLLGVRDANTR